MNCKPAYISATALGGGAGVLNIMRKSEKKKRDLNIRIVLLPKVSKQGKAASAAEGIVIAGGWHPPSPPQARTPPEGGREKLRPSHPEPTSASGPDRQPLVRCLPNPYWETELRDMTGLDKTVIDFLETEDSARELVNQISGFLEHWLPHYDEETRSYLTVALGCTGGQHRSVYVAQRLAEHFQYRDAPVQVAHRDLNMNSLPT